MKKILFGIALFLISVGQVYSADTIKGANTYSKYCANCHGVSGMSEMAGAPNFALGERLMRSDNAILQSVREGKNAMPAFQGLLSNEEILNTIAFIRTMSF